MRMDDIRVGQVYRRANNRGRDGISISTQHVVVDATHVAKPFSGRYDRVQVHNVARDCDEEGNFKGTYTYTGAYDADGNPYRYLLMAREIVTLEEAEAAEEESRRQREERDRRRKAEKDFTEHVAKTMAARLGVDHNCIEVFAQYVGTDDDGNFKFRPMSARVNQRAMEAMMESDPDPILIADILDEIEPEVLRAMNSQQLAEHIVGGLRYEPATEEAE